MLRRVVLPAVGLAVVAAGVAVGLAVRGVGPTGSAAPAASEEAGGVDVSGLVDNRPSPPGSPPPATEAAPSEVRIELGDDPQALVDATPPGTTFVFAAGVHREVSIIPRDGDRFTGEAGAVLSGARDLTHADWSREGETWVVGGQTQQGLVHGEIAEDGEEADRYPEEVFVDGERLQHVGSVAEVGPESFTLDYDRDELHIGVDPASVSLIEASTTVGAFGGTGVRDVVIEGLTIEHYATPTQHGAIGFHEEHWTYDWTVRDTTVRQNHGAGIRLGPGMTLERVRVLDNGQLGVGGDGIDRTDGPTGGYQAPVTIVDSEISGNGVLSFDWGWEAGGVKIKNALAGSVFERNVVRGNDGPGAWWDIDDRDAVIRDNVIEDNTVLGIFYEISFGETTIEGNHVRRNGPRDADHGVYGVGILVSSSSGVRVSGNTVEDQAIPILLQDTDRGTSDRLGPRVLADVDVVGNRIVRSGPVVVTDPDAPGLRFEDNLYEPAEGGPPSFVLGEDTVGVGGWNEAGFDPHLTQR